MENQAMWAAILAAVLALSEALAFIPKLKSNSVFQLILNVLKKFAGKGK